MFGIVCEIEQNLKQYFQEFFSLRYIYNTKKDKENVFLC